MPGISYLRPQYTSLAGSATRLAGGGRQVAHEMDINQIASLGEGRSNGGQEEALLPEVVVRAPADQQGGQGGQDKDSQKQQRPPAAPQAAVGRDASGGDFHVDPHLPPAERMAGTGLVIAAPLPMSERLLAAEQAYGYSRDVLNGGQAKPGEGFDSAS